MRDLALKPEYSTSHALVVGINDYKHLPPLCHATKDATEVGSVLRGAFGFPAENVKILIDDEATRANILAAFYAFEKTTVTDSRLLVFFAGHGVTKAGRHGEVGFLAPQDAVGGDVPSLIRWQELIQGAELIPAKHVFVRDGCMLRRSFV